MHFSRPRPTPSKPHLGCSPNTPSNPVSMDGVGVDELSGIYFCGRAPTHPLCVVDPPNHAATRVVRAATEALPRVVHTRPKTKDQEAHGDTPRCPPVPKGRQAPTRGESRLAMKDERFGRSPDETDAPGTPMPKAPNFLGQMSIRAARSPAGKE